MSIILAAGALIPGIVLLAFIFKKDRADKEPVGLLLKLLALGAATVIPVSLVSVPVFNVIYAIFGVDEVSAAALTGASYYLYNFVDAFFGVALIEEGFKWLVLFLVTRKNKNFNSLFDGIIYAVFVSLGFAILENVLYVFSFGFETAILRAFTAVPGHMFDGVIMGYYYTLWHAETVADNIEKAFITKGLLPSTSNKFVPARLLVLSLVMPVVAHGIYDFCCFIEDGWATAIFYVFLIGLYVYCFKTINKMSKGDMGDFNYSVIAFNKKYPELQQHLIAYVQEVYQAAQRAQVYAAAYSNGAPVNNPYGAQQTAPGAVPVNNPYGAQRTAPGAVPVNNPYGAQQTAPGAAPVNNPYGAQQTAPGAAPVNNPYGAQSNVPYSVPVNNPYGAQQNKSDTSATE